jgi:hypothetical protein
VGKRPSKADIVADHIGAAQIGRKQAGIYRKAMEGRSRVAAIKAFCYECQGWEGPEPVKNCAARACPLWAFRPGH